MRHSPRIVLHLLSGFFFLYVLAFSFFLFFPEHFYRDLFINFLPYLLICHVPIVLVYLTFHLFSGEQRWISRGYLLFFLFSLFVQSGMLIAPYFQTSKSFASEPRGELKIISANVLKTNTDYEKTLAFIDREKPDVFGLIELTEEFALAMEPLKLDYPYQVTFPYEAGFGIGLYSKKPLLNPKVELLSGGIPYIESFIEVNQQKIHLFVIHAIPPFNQEMFEARNTSLLEIATQLDHSPTVVMGDFNLTPWSEYYKKFIHNTGLVNTRDMWKGLQHSWYSWGLYLPIDHVFISRDIRTMKSSLGEDIGSDHLPVVAELAFVHE